MSNEATQSVFEAVLARTVAGQPGLVHLWWRAPEQGERLVQVYVDGELMEVSTYPAQRELWLMVEPSCAHRIELLAVPTDEPGELWREQGEKLGQGGTTPGAKFPGGVALLRDERWPVDTVARVMVDGAEVEEGPVWPTGENRSGFGALFGWGEFGWDAATGPGLGVGELGLGLLGVDGTAWRWRRADLAAGSHSVAVALLDGGGRAVAIPPPIVNFDIVRPADSAEALSMNAGFELSW